MDESLVSDTPKEHRPWSNEGDIKPPSKKSVLIWSAINLPCDRAEVVEGWGVLVEESCESPGRGCVKKGTPEGDSEEGESETG